MLTRSWVFRALLNLCWIAHSQKATPNCGRHLPSAQPKLSRLGVAPRLLAPRQGSRGSPWPSLLSPSRWRDSLAPPSRVLTNFSVGASPWPRPGGPQHSMIQPKLSCLRAASRWMTCLGGWPHWLRSLQCGNWDPAAVWWWPARPETTSPGCRPKWPPLASSGKNFGETLFQ